MVTSLKNYTWFNYESEHRMEREGYDVSNAELSMRLYDSELTENKGYYNQPEPINYYQGA